MYYAKNTRNILGVRHIDISFLDVISWEENFIKDVINYLHFYSHFVGNHPYNSIEIAVMVITEDFQDQI